MKIGSRLLILIAALLASGPVESRAPNFKTLLNLSPDRSTQGDVLKWLGQPTEKRELTWDYDENSVVRVSIFFEKSSDKLSGWYWFIRETDAERDLKNVLAQFPGAAWEVDTIKWANPHEEPMECFFRERDRGIEIQYSRPKKRVTAITAWNPSRMVSSEESGTAPIYCIGNTCTQAKLVKEVYKDVPLCELPK